MKVPKGVKHVGRIDVPSKADKRIAWSPTGERLAVPSVNGIRIVDATSVASILKPGVDGIGGRSDD
jgi:hypothetical protein